MSERPQDWDKSRDEIISGEYVLGVLSELDRKRVEARITTDPKFAMQVRRWQENLADFNDEHETRGATLFAFAKPEIGFSDPEAEANPRFWKELWGSALFWRSVSAAALAGLIAISLFDRTPLSTIPQPSRSLVAELEGMNSPINLVATYELNSGKLTVAPSALQKDKPQSLQVWAVEEGKAPVSLGVLPEAGKGEIVVSQLLRQNLGRGKIIAVTTEPLGGSPSGRPTGPVIAVGRARLL